MDWLLDNKTDGSLVILDARTAEEYALGHIPGARSFPCADTEDLTDNREHTIAPIPAINRVIGDAGIDMNTRVVIYGGRDYRSPARVFWVLEAHGHPAVTILDGGVEAWQQAGFQLSDEVETWSAKKFVASLRPEVIVDKLAMYRALTDDDAVILDARPRNEFLGRSNRGTRAGRIPRAQHIDADANLYEREGIRWLRPKVELSKLYASVDKSKKIYAYCHIGWRAAVDYWALRVLDYDVAMYDGSWQEWSADINLPIETADAVEI